LAFHCNANNAQTKVQFCFSCAFHFLHFKAIISCALTPSMPIKQKLCLWGISYLTRNILVNMIVLVAPLVTSQGSSQESSAQNFVKEDGPRLQGDCDHRRGVKEFQGISSAYHCRNESSCYFLETGHIWNLGNRFEAFFLSLLQRNTDRRVGNDDF
jgi:hypothetical protein